MAPKHERKRQLRQKICKKNAAILKPRLRSIRKWSGWCVSITRIQLHYCNRKRLELFEKRKVLPLWLPECSYNGHTMDSIILKQYEAKLFPIYRRIDSISFHYKICLLFQMKNDSCKTFNDQFFYIEHRTRLSILIIFSC